MPYYDLNVPWAPNEASLPQTLAFLYERTSELLQIFKHALLIALQSDTTLSHCRTRCRASYLQS